MGEQLEYGLDNDLPRLDVVLVEGRSGHSHCWGVSPLCDRRWTGLWSIVERRRLEGRGQRFERRCVLFLIFLIPDGGLILLPHSGSSDGHGSGGAGAGAGGGASATGGAGGNGTSRVFPVSLPLFNLFLPPFLSPRSSRRSPNSFLRLGFCLLTSAICTNSWTRRIRRRCASLPFLS
jgi:hypothetical protein